MILILFIRARQRVALNADTPGKACRDERPRA